MVPLSLRINLSLCVCVCVCVCVCLTSSWTIEFKRTSDHHPAGEMPTLTRFRMPSPPASTTGLLASWGWTLCSCSCSAPSSPKRDSRGPRSVPLGATEGSFSTSDHYSPCRGHADLKTWWLKKLAQLTQILQDLQ